MTDLQIVDEIKANKWEYTEYCFLCLSKYYTKFACMMTHSRKIILSISAYSAKSDEIGKCTNSQYFVRKLHNHICWDPSSIFR